MSEETIRYPLLELFYQQYLADENSANFIQSVSVTYTIGTLERLARYGGRVSRRAAVLAIGFLGNFRNNETMGHALVDRDRAVRMLADHGIRQIWKRQGTSAQQQTFEKLYRLNALDRWDEVVDTATRLIDANPGLGEAWSQRAIARSATGDFFSAIEDCREALNCNRFHFPAAIGLGHCCLQLDDVTGALVGFRLALRIHPDLDGVRTQIQQLERLLKDG